MRMKSPLFSRVLFCAVLLTAPIFTSCGSSASSTLTPLLVSVSISSSSVNMTFGETRTFRATVTGSLNQMVTWSVQEGSPGGTINSSGVYVAPGTFGTFHVVAASQADSTKRATATVVVGPLSISISPSAALVGPSTARTFVASVTGSSNTDVTWNVLEATGGTITKAGFYTAPIALGTYHVVATSVADTSKNATAAVTVVSSGFSTPTGSMHSARGFFTATLLANGRVLVAGGDGGDNPDCVAGSSLAEVYDPSIGSFTGTGNMTTERYAHTATRLPNGKVLVTGGFGNGGFNGAFGLAPPVSGSAELYDPATGSFDATGSMATPRAAHTATLLPDGKVLIVGGLQSIPGSDGAFPYFGDGGIFCGTAVSGSNGSFFSAEIYDPATEAFTPTGSMATPRYAHTATLLANGKVLIAGGMSISGSSLVVNSTAELYDPATRVFAPAGSMGTDRAGHTAMLLADGKVLIAGGLTDNTNLTVGVLTAEIYDPVPGSFTPTGNMGTARVGHTAALLPSGKVLVAGGQFSNPLSTTELYDPGTGSFTAAGAMQTGRVAHTATLLQNGTTLLAGGDLGDGFQPIASAELYK
jgi:Galactose oxidase, central domain